MKIDYIEQLEKQIAERFARARGDVAKPKPGLTVEQKAEILCNVAMRKMR